MSKIAWLVGGALALAAAGCGGESPADSAPAPGERAAAEPSHEPNRPTPLPGVPVIPITPAVEQPSSPAPQGTQISYCPGKRTTRISLQANIDAGSWTPYSTWDVNNAASSSNFSTTFAVYSTTGDAFMLDLYFTKLRENEWAYHAVFGAVPNEIGDGTLTFGGDGSLRRHREHEPVRLVGDHGFEPPLELDFGTPTELGGSGFDGVSQVSGPSNVSSQTQDGIASGVGFPCPNGVLLPTPPARPPTTTSEQAVLDQFGMCVPKATSGVAFRLNLSRTASFVPVPWEAKNPLGTSSYATRFSAHDEVGRAASFGLYFRKIGELVWDYHVSLLSDGSTGVDLANGTLTFLENGALSRKIERAPLYFPNPDGTRGALITLDFGDKGSIEGATSFESSSRLSGLTQDGHGLTYGSACTASEGTDFFGSQWSPESYQAQATWDDSSYCGWGTDYVGAALVLNAGLPVDESPWDDTAPDRASEVHFDATIYDINGRAVPIRLRMRHLQETTWEGRLLDLRSATPNLLASFWVHYGNANQQLPSSIDGDDGFRLPLEDGSPGPRITLDWGSRAPGSIYSIFLDTQTQGTLNVNGTKRTCWGG